MISSPAESPRDATTASRVPLNAALILEFALACANAPQQAHPTATAASAAVAFCRMETLRATSSAEPGRGFSFGALGLENFGISDSSLFMLYCAARASSSAAAIWSCTPWGMSRSTASETASGSADVPAAKWYLRCIAGPGGRQAVPAV